MLVRIKTQATGKPVDRALQVPVIERHKTPAGITQHMMMVDARGVDQLIARHGITQLQTRHQSAILKQIEDAIDTRASDTPLPGAQLIFDLNGTESTRLLSQQVDDRVPRPTLTMPSLAEHRTSVLGPLQSA